MQAPAAPTIDPAEFSRLQSEVSRLAPYEQRFKGVQPFYETAGKYGFKKPEDFDRLRPLTDKGVKLENLASIFASEPTDDGPPLSLDAIQKMLDERDGKARTSAAEAEHEKLLSEEMGNLSEKSIRDLIGDKEGKAPKELVDLLLDAAFGRYVSSRQPYPEGHALAGRIGGAGKEWFGGLGAGLTKGLTAAQAHKLAQVGAAAGAATPSVAGATPAGGRPEKSVRPDGKPSKESIEALYEARKAARLARSG